MTRQEVERLLTNVWNAGRDHGIRITENAHQILDNPVVLTENLGIPLFIDLLPQPRVGMVDVAQYAYHYFQALKLLEGRAAKNGVPRNSL